MAYLHCYPPMHFQIVDFRLMLYDCVHAHGGDDDDGGGVLLNGTLNVFHRQLTLHLTVMALADRTNMMTLILFPPLLWTGLKMAASLL